MNKLLPTKAELIPIMEEGSRFEDCCFREPFDSLDFESKLQVVNDIIRQSMIFDRVPNPDNDVENLIGDSYTAALASKRYIESLKLGCECKCVLCKGTDYIPKNAVSDRFALLIKHEKLTYFFDATPLVGFMYGKVCDLRKVRPFKEYVTIDSEMNMQETRRINYYTHIGKKLSDWDKKRLLRLHEQRAPENAYYLSECYRHIIEGNYSDNKEWYDRLVEINPWSDALESMDPQNDKDNRVAHNSAILNKYSFMPEQIREWITQLDNVNRKVMITPDSKTKREQLELLQSIYGGLVESHFAAVPKVSINGKMVPITRITPRLCMEKNWQVISVEQTETGGKKSHELEDGEMKVLNVSSANVVPDGVVKKDTFVIRDRREYNRSVVEKAKKQQTTFADVALVSGTAETIEKNREELENKHTENLGNNGKDKVNTTVDGVDASMDLSMMYPEFQVMNKYMYPNPRIKPIKQVEVNREKENTKREIVLNGVRIQF